MLRVDRRVFTLLRSSPDGIETVLCMVNVSGREVPLEIDLSYVGAPESEEWQDLIGGEVFPAPRGKLDITLRPYQSAWLRSGTRPGFRSKPE